MRLFSSQVEIIVSTSRLSPSIHDQHLASLFLPAGFQQKHMFPCTRPLDSYCSKFESVWMTLADSMVAQRQALRNICAGGGGLQHPYNGFQDDSRGSTHCAGFSRGHRLYLAQSSAAWKHRVQTSWPPTRKTSWPPTRKKGVYNQDPIMLCSKLQKTAALSTAEAEYYSASTARSDVPYLRKLPDQLGIGFAQQSPTPVCEDNTACIEWGNRDNVIGGRERAKALRPQCHPEWRNATCQGSIWEFAPEDILGYVGIW